MPSRKRISNTYWSTNMFAPSVARCIPRITCHRLSAAIYVLVDQYVIAQAQQYVLTDQYIIAEEQQYVLVNQYVIQNRQQYALITPICHKVQYYLQYILKFISYCPRYGFFIYFLKAGKDSH